MIASLASQTRGARDNGGPDVIETLLENGAAALPGARRARAAGTCGRRGAVDGGSTRTHRSTVAGAGGGAGAGGRHQRGWDRRLIEAERVAENGGCEDRLRVLARGTGTGTGAGV